MIIKYTTLYLMLGLPFTFLTNTVAASCLYEQSIQGENLQIGTMLTWSTSFEEHNAMFIIEKSEDGGANFINIGSVDGSGDSDELKEYNFLDVISSSMKSYYRLKQVDFDGSFSYSGVTTVPQKYKNNFMVANMSNVATQDLFDLTLDAFVEGELTYSLVNYKKEVIIEDKILIIDGLNDLTFDLVDQKPGIYKVSLSMEGEHETLVIRKIADEIKNKTNVATKNKMDKSKN